MILSKADFATRTGLDADTVIATLRAAAEAAAQKTLPRFRTGLAVDNKLDAGFDPVTDADRTAEQAIRQVVADHFPGHDVIGEEHEDTANGSEFAWIVDPVDGTRSFIAGVPLWGTLIGFAHKGEVLAGLMTQPFIGETFIGGPGTALYQRGGQNIPRQDIPLGVSGRKDLAEARLFSTTPDLFDTADRAAAWDALHRGALQTRYGCDCYAYALLAAGHADLVVEPHLNVYDIAALIPIIEAAGGSIATWDGKPADTGGDVVAAASPQLLDAALEVIADATAGL